ncbi:MAG: phytanoyl-CoA dioxygenase family protein [Actinomycetota bacterium]|nr:phytanoyl-CoA dioxygenase family protein [Actinomycetota bacterium]MEC9338395.1 phytanoyl-CoA dioxygenase family protein [Actinomycetota bacterium]
MFLSARHAAAWDRDGFFLVKEFSPPDVCDAMLRRAIDLAREADGRGVAGTAIVHPERNLADSMGSEALAEERVSKVFKVHRDSVFHEFATQPDLVASVQHLLGTDIDCFLSQFIFKNPGAWGQPWHQDAFYFPFDRGPQVGVWLAVTEATLANGCLHVVPGSHLEPVHEHLLDRRPNANQGYVEILDHDMSGERPVTMAPGDLLIFHSHLMHRSKDNNSSAIRAAMVYHFGERGTVDLAEHPAPINDWMPVGERRVG